MSIILRELIEVLSVMYFYFVNGKVKDNWEVHLKVEVVGNILTMLHTHL